MAEATIAAVGDEISTNTRRASMAVQVFDFRMDVAVCDIMYYGFRARHCHPHLLLLRGLSSLPCRYRNWTPSCPSWKGNCPRVHHAFGRSVDGLGCLLACCVIVRPQCHAEAKLFERVTGKRSSAQVWHHYE